MAASLAESMRFTYLSANLLFWASGLGIMGYSCWLLLSSGVSLLGDYLALISSLAALGALVFITGFIGFLGAVLESEKTVRVFLGVLVAALLLEAVLGATLQLISSQINVSSLWNQTSQEVKYSLQSQLQCCGLTGSDDYQNASAIHTSCFQSITTGGQTLLIPWSATCGEKMSKEADSVMWGCVALIATLFVIQVTGGVGALFLARRTYGEGGFRRT